MLVLDLSQCCDNDAYDDRFAPIIEPVVFATCSADSVRQVPLLQTGQKVANTYSSDTSSLGDAGGANEEEEDADSPPVSPNGSPTVILQSRRLVQQLKRQEKIAMEKTAAEVCH
jgi:hypothetical protein